MSSVSTEICVSTEIFVTSKAKPARNADHVRRKNAPAPSDGVIEARLKSLLTPAILGQQGYARLLGLRERILSFPAALFQRVLMGLLPRLDQRWAERQRPLPTAVMQARRHFREFLLVDGSTLEALFRKLKALEDVRAGQFRSGLRVIQVT